jgi:hypothetical protein
MLAVVVAELIRQLRAIMELVELAVVVTED